VLPVSSTTTYSNDHVDVEYWDKDDQLWSTILPFPFIVILVEYCRVEMSEQFPGIEQVDVP